MASLRTGVSAMYVRIGFTVGARIDVKRTSSGSVVSRVSSAAVKFAQTTYDPN
jgi:hypothetical protein